jgi:hypothetical protein
LLALGLYAVGFVRVYGAIFNMSLLVLAFVLWGMEVLLCMVDALAQ